MQDVMLDMNRSQVIPLNKRRWTRSFCIHICHPIYLNFDVACDGIFVSKDEVLTKYKVNEHTRQTYNDGSITRRMSNTGDAIGA